MDGKNRNYGLDAARCLAILLVFCIHASQNIFSANVPYIWYLAHAGVEIFFALSGFLIGKILFDTFLANNGRLNFADFKNFLIRRWFRTLPLYYFIYLTLLVLYSLSMYKEQPGWEYFFFLNNFTYWHSGFFGESWTLAVEEWFYILFASTLFSATFIFTSATKRTFTAVSASNLFARLLIFFIVFIWIVKLSVLQKHQYDNITTIVIFRLDAIAYGILAYWLYCRYKIKLVIILPISIVCIFIALMIKFTYPDSTILGMSYYFIAGIGYAGFVLSLRLYSWRRTYSIVSHISKISYSIYITHLSLILLPLMKFYQPKTLFQKVVFFLVYTTLTYLTSILTYTIIERSFNKIRDRYFGRRTAQ